MTERGLDRLLVGLGAQLEAAERRADEEAADDLAFSLAQDSLMVDVLTRAGAVTAMASGGGRLSVSAVGRDFVWIENPAPQILPLTRAVVSVEERGRAPARWDTTLLETCRKLARTGAIVQVTCGFGSPLGRLERAGRDFLAVATEHGRVVSPYTAIHAIRVIRGGSAGGL